MMKSVKMIAFAAALAAVLSSCGEYAEFENLEVVEDTYTGTLEVTSTGADPAGDFSGENESGTYSFAWENTDVIASANFDVTTEAGGTVQLIINDARGNEVLNVTRPENGNDTFADVSAEGQPGMWLITFVFDNVTGDGSYSIHSGS